MAYMNDMILLSISKRESRQSIMANTYLRACLLIIYFIFYYFIICVLSEKLYLSMFLCIIKHLFYVIFKI